MVYAAATYEKYFAAVRTAKCGVVAFPVFVGTEIVRIKSLRRHLRFPLPFGRVKPSQPSNEAVEKVPDPEIARFSVVRLSLRGARSSNTARSERSIFSSAQRNQGDRTFSTASFGIGGGLTTPPLPHHRTNGSRIRRFGRLSQCTATTQAAHQPERPLLPRQPRFHPIEALARRMQYRSSLAIDYSSLLLPSRGSVRAFSLQKTQDLLRPLQTSFSRSEGIASPSANFFRTRNPRARERSPGVRPRTFRA